MLRVWYGKDRNNAWHVGQKYYGGNSMLLTSGPVNKDYVLGELYDWHLEALNNSGVNTQIVLAVYALYGLYPHPVLIGTTSVDLKPGEYSYLTLQTDNHEHTIPVVQIPNNDVLITLYGRDKDHKEISGVVYPRTALVELRNSLCVGEE